MSSRHRTLQQLEKGLDGIRLSPREAGTLDLIVRRPAVGRREALEQAALDPEHGLVGDDWERRGSTRTADGMGHPEMQVTVMNSRVIALIAGDPSRWGLAGDQLYIDMDLSGENLPPGTRIAIGQAEIEVTAQPHTGCRKFMARFGPDAVKFVNSPDGRRLNLRGINARVTRAGTVRTGDLATRVAGSGS